MIETFTPSRGVSTLRSLTPADGIKIESWAYDSSANVIYFGAREGGDLTQLAGKGAGAIGRIDVASGAVKKLGDFHYGNHGAKVRGLTFHAHRLWFLLEEGGNLNYETGKGGGVLASYNLTTGQITRHHVFDTATGLKPRTLVVVDSDLFFATEKGGTGGLGVFGALLGGERFELIGEFDAAIGAKPDFAMSVIGRCIYFTPELGTSGFLGGISAYEFPALAAHLFLPCALCLRCFQFSMLLALAGGAAGLILHFLGNLEFERELHPEARGWTLVWATLKGATPALAPRMMILLGLLGLTVTAAPDEPNQTDETTHTLNP